MSFLWLRPLYITGEKALDNLQQHIEANPGSMQQQKPTLGNCLLGDLPAELSSQDAVAICQRWSETGKDPLDTLQHLAPAWQKPEGFKGFNKKQLAVVDRLRGLVLLGRATAVLGSPIDVMQVG